MVDKYANRWRTKIGPAPEKKPWVVMLRACLPEHEGNDGFACDFDNEMEAKEWVASQNGFFKAGDYYVVSRPAPTA